MAALALVAGGCGASEGSESSVDAGIGADGQLVSGGCWNGQLVGELCECFDGYAGDECGSCAPGYLAEGGVCVAGCGPDTCSGRGTCTMLGGQAVCECEGDWAEPFCEACERGFAEEGGTCVDLCAGRDCSGRGICDAWSGHAICLCDTGYIGPDCEDCAPFYGLVDGACQKACEPDTCNGHGYCDGATGVAICECWGGYIGDTCGECPLGYLDTGESCEPVCEVTPCNNASCEGSSGEAVCTCYDTYQGAECESCTAGYVDLGGGVCGAQVLDIEGDLNRTCALLDNGTMRCWGTNTFGHLGYPGLESVGCEELPIYAAGAVDLEGTIVQIAAGREHTCVLLDDATLRCFGNSANAGKLGYGSGEAIGDDEPVDAGGPVPVGGPVEQVSVGSSNTCAILEGTRDLRCWGWGASLFLTESHTPIGDDELAEDGPIIPLGGPVVQVELGAETGCARREDGGVRCWGSNGFGVLGAGVPGAWMPPESLSDVPLPGPAIDVGVGDWHACAVIEGGALYCWGLGSNGRLGYGHSQNLGKGETPLEIGPVDVGGPVARVLTASDATCALLESGALRCWGGAVGGKLGYPAVEEDIGDDEVPADMGDIALPAKVVDVAMGDRYTCALLETGGVRCWGQNAGSCALGTGAQVQGVSSPDPMEAADAALFYGQ